MTRRTIRWVVTIMAIGTLIAGGLGVLKGTAIAEQAAAPLGTARVAATRIDAGDLHTCAVLEDASLRCWGNGAVGQLGYGNTDTIGDDETPGGPVDIGAGRTATALAAGGDHTCAALDDGSVRCWGFGTLGQLGYGNTDTIGDDETPRSAGPVDLGAGRTATAITTGANHTCAILDDASVRCWGAGFAGQLGYGNTDTIGDDETPGAAGAVDLGAGRTATAITTGANHTCAILDDASARCWGAGGFGRLGFGNTDDHRRRRDPRHRWAHRLGCRAHRHRHRRRCQPHVRDPRRRQRALLGGRVRRPARVRQHRHDRRRRDPRHRWAHRLGCRAHRHRADDRCRPHLRRTR